MESKSEPLCRERIASCLGVLVGLPLWGAGRAGATLWLQFGAKKHLPTKRSPHRVVGDFALHVQCPWRVSAFDTVVVASGDGHGSIDHDERGFDPHRPGDELRRWIDAHANGPLQVTSVDVDGVGGFALQLAMRHTVVVFPDVGAAVRPEVELWRLLRPGRDLEHVVLLSSGLEVSTSAR